ncbi:MAG: RNA methyltransferase [Myxococcales bacterium FL481]|nr:MAG: RNA methyltransferase [Myxococcales bacterium FL481]
MGAERSPRAQLVLARAGCGSAKPRGATRGVRRTRDVGNETPIDDPILDPFRDLKASPRTGLGIAEGAIVIRRALALGAELERLVCTPCHAAALADVLPPGLPVRVLPKASLARLVGYPFHRGCLATVRVPGEDTLPEPVRAQWRRQSELTLVVGSRLADPVNVGAIVRSAAALGATGCLFDARCANPFERRAVRASMGHVFAGTTWPVAELEPVLEMLRHDVGATVYASSPNPGGRSVARVTWSSKRVLCFGHEGEGLPSPLLDLADERVFVPMVGGVDSLNVAATAAIVLYAVSTG